MVLINTQMVQNTAPCPLPKKETQGARYSCLAPNEI